MRPFRGTLPDPEPPVPDKPYRMWARTLVMRVAVWWAWFGARCRWIAQRARGLAQPPRQGVRAALLALFIEAWLLWRACAPWLTALRSRAHGWLAPQLQRLRQIAAAVSAVASNAGARLRALCRRAAPVWGRITRWLAAYTAAARRGLGALVASVRATQTARATHRGALATETTHDADDLEFSQEDLDDAEIATELAYPRAAGASPWVPRLSRRARVWRGVLIAGSVGLAVFVVMGGPSTVLDGLQQWAYSLAPSPVNAAPRPQLNASFWVGRRVPAPAVYVRGINLSPSAADSALAYACWVDSSAASRQATSALLYVTPDGARSWQALTVPAGQASSCRAVPDVADTRRLLLLLAPPSAGACVAPRVYDSADRGQTWLPVKLPDELATACDLVLYPSHGVIYAYSLAGVAQPGGPASQLLVSNDDGGSWQVVFSAAEANSAVSIVAARADGALLVLVSAAGREDGQNQGRGSAPGTAQYTLWCRAASDASWQSLGALPEGTSAAYAADGERAGSGCAWGTLYAAGFTNGDDPSITRLEITDGHGWSALPPLPISTASVDHPLTPDGHVLTVGPDGQLLVDSIYTGPGLGITTGTSSPAHTFWGWDRNSTRWLTDIHIAPANSSIDGFVWDYSQSGMPRLICWMYTLNAGIPAYTGLYRAAFAAPSAPSQDSDGQRAPGL